MSKIELKGIDKKINTIYEYGNCKSIFEAVLTYSDGDIHKLHKCFESNYIFEKIRQEKFSKEDQSYILHNVIAHRVNELYPEAFDKLESKELFDFFNGDSDHYNQAFDVLYDNTHLIEDPEDFEYFLEHQLECAWSDNSEMADIAKCLFQAFHNKMSFDTLPIYENILDFSGYVAKEKEFNKKFSTPSNSL
jgi:hypothetical protein